MIEKYQIEENDKIKIAELFQLIPSITEKNTKLEKNEKEFSLIKREIKSIYKRNEIPTKEQKDNLKKMRLNFEIAQKEYFEPVSNWNLEMDKIIEKYNYITLKKFLIKNPLKSIGINPDFTFSANTKKIAEMMNVPILQSLYSGEPKFLNNYPEKWLLKVYLEIDKMSTQKRLIENLPKMENIPKIKEINIIGYEYNFENYLSDLKSYNSNQNYILDKEEKSKRYNQKIDILLSENSERIKILRGIFFSDIKDWELFEILSILEFYQPELCYIYYKVGEKYGETDNTIVKLENKLIKKLFIYHNNQNVLIKTFIDEQMKFLDETDINKIVNIYFRKRLKKSEVKTTDDNYFKTNSDLINKTEFNTEKINKFRTQKDYDRERGINVDAWDYGDNLQIMFECSRDEEREANRDTYSDGGGGQEWSDYSEIN